MTIPTHRHPFGVIRREFLQVGFSGFLGMGLPGILARQSQAAGRGANEVSASPRAKSMILVFLTGGLCHIDSFDPKPEAPDGIRGDFKPIQTAAPGVHYSEVFPKLAQRADRLAVVRSMSHGFNNHLNATHEVLTGHPQPGAFFDKIASRTDFPCYASTLSYLRPQPDGVPSGVNLPTFLMEGPLVWPGQHAGFLGPKYDPWQIKQDPNGKRFKVEDLSLPEGFSVERLGSRRGLLDEMARQRDHLGEATSDDPMGGPRDLAYSLLLSGKVGRAFELGREQDAVRDRYGRHAFGQSLLLARRLVEAGVPIVQVNMGRVQNWDTHDANCKTLKQRLVPPTDQGVSALLDDLAERGLLDETLVIMTGEFGRTPRIGANAGNGNTASGRDHWSNCFSTVFAGGGIRGGQAIGQSDRLGAYPGSRPYRPADLAATVYSAFGLDPAVELRDKLDRPIRLCDGEVIRPLYDGATV